MQIRNAVDWKKRMINKRFWLRNCDVHNSYRTETSVTSKQQQEKSYSVDDLLSLIQFSSFYFATRKFILIKTANSYPDKATLDDSRVVVDEKKRSLVMPTRHRASSLREKGFMSSSRIEMFTICMQTFVSVIRLRNVNNLICRCRGGEEEDEKIVPEQNCLTNSFSLQSVW